MRRSCLILALIFLLAGCSGSQSAEVAQAPAAPKMPAGWSVTSDESFAPDDIRPVADNLGGAIEALRNTIYDVKGKSVKVNTLVTASAADADNVMKSLRAIKPDDFLLRRGLTIYEFVGTNDVMPEMRQGKAHLQANLGS